MIMKTRTSCLQQSRKFATPGPASAKVGLLLHSRRNSLLFLCPRVQGSHIHPPKETKNKKV